MHKNFAILVLVSMTAFAAGAQSNSSTQTPPTTKPAPKSGTTAKPPVHRAATGAPTAVIDTTAGTLRCTLFEKETPETVANFIGFARRNQGWQEPAPGPTKNRPPLSAGTTLQPGIPHLTIPARGP